MNISILFAWPQDRNSQFIFPGLFFFIFYNFFKGFVFNLGVSCWCPIHQLCSWSAELSLMKICAFGYKQLLWKSATQGLLIFLISVLFAFWFNPLSRVFFFFFPCHWLSLKKCFLESRCFYDRFCMICLLILFLIFLRKAE